MAAVLDALVPEAEQTARGKILASGVVSPCPTASRVNRPAVIEDPDIFRAAKLLIDGRGEYAAPLANFRGEELRIRGYVEASELWASGCRRHR